MFLFQRNLKKGILLFGLCFLLICRYAKALSSNNTQTFQFAVLGCIHAGVSGFDDYRKAIKKIKTYQPNFVIFLGGMFEPTAEDTVKTQWERFENITKSLNCPVYDVPSNCHVSFLSFIKDKKLIEKLWSQKYKKRFYTFTYKNNLFIGLDSRTILKEGENQGQLEFLKKVLSKAQSYTNIFIFQHNSYWFSEDADLWFKKIHPILKRAKVRYVFAAHSHCLDMQELDNIIYITTGVPPYQGLPYTGRFTFPHFLFVKVNGKDVSIDVVPLKKSIPLAFIGTSLVKKEKSLLNLKIFRKRHSQMKPKLLTSYEREYIIKPEKVLKVMKISPGMNILDIGAGTGFFTFRFANALKGSGRVYATEIDPNMIKKLEEEKISKGANNVFILKVNPNQVGNFKKQQFDRVFACEVYQYLRNPKNFFKNLRPYLKKTGRLYIINAKNVYNFTEIEFDFKNFIETLLSYDKDFPVLIKLSPDVQQFIKNWHGEPLPSFIKKKIVQDFNRMLLDKTLFCELMDYFARKGIIAGEGEWSAPLEIILDRSDILLFKWLYTQLEKKEVFNRKLLNESEKKYLKKMNRLLLSSLFNLKNIFYLLGELGPPIYSEKEVIISTLESIGYKLTQEYNFLPYHYFLEFRP